MKRFLVFSLLAYICADIRCQDFKGFDDTVLFKMNWPGEDEEIVVNTIFHFNFDQISPNEECPCSSMI